MTQRYLLIFIFNVNKFNNNFLEVFFFDRKLLHFDWKLWILGPKLTIFDPKLSFINPELLIIGQIIY